MPEPEMLPEMLTVNQVAKMLGKSPWWVYERVYRREIPYKQPGGKGGAIMFSRRAIEEWLNRPQWEEPIKPARRPGRRPARRLKVVAGK